MVKNEMSINATETYNIETRVADNRLQAFKNQVNVRIFKVNKLTDFKSKKQSLNIFNKQKKIILNALSNLKLDNSNSPRRLFEQELKELNNLIWSYTKIDRTNPNREAIKKQLVSNRVALAELDNAINKYTFDEDREEEEFNREYDYRLEYENAIEECYEENTPRLSEIPYASYIEKANQEYDAIALDLADKIDALGVNVIAALDKSFETYTKLNDKQKLIALRIEITTEYNRLFEIEKLIKLIDVDLKVLLEQRKEKLDVDAEEKELLAKQEDLKKQKEKLQNTISYQEAELALKAAEVRNIERLTIGDSENASEEDKIIELIYQTFDIGNEIEFTINLFNALEKYVRSLCPTRHQYLLDKYAAFKAESKQYRASNINNIQDAKAKSVYNNEEKYIRYITGFDNQDIKSKVAPLEEEHKQKLAELEAQHKADLDAIKTAKEQRKHDYIEQKNNAKVALKVADAKKASDLKEVTKIYKKAINDGEHDRYASAAKENKRRIKEAEQQYRVAYSELIQPKPLAIKYKHDVIVEKATKKLDDSREELRKEINKERHVARYRKNMTIAKREQLLGWGFIAIWAIGFIVLTLIPIIYSILLMFSNVTFSPLDGYSKVIDITFSQGKLFPSWVGTQNFENLFLSEYTFTYVLVPQFFRSLLLYVPIVVFISFLLALLLNTKIKGRTLFRIIYFLPVVIVSGPVLSMLNNENSSGGSSIRLSLDGSAIASILQSLSPNLLKYANEVFNNFIVILWMTGVPIVLFISALQKIDKSLYEAADIDGANGWQKLWTVTFPLIKSVMLIVTLFTIMQVATIDVGFVNPLKGWLDTAISNINYGIASVGAWVQTIIILLFVLIAFLLFREKNYVPKEKNYIEVEEMKLKKEQQKAKREAFFHTVEIKNFFLKLSSPFKKASSASKEKKRKKEEMGG